MRTACLFCVAWVALASPGLAAASQCYRTQTGVQAEAASTYLPLGHWGYRYANLLIARGRLPALDPLIQPYRRADLARAVAEAARDATISDVEREWLDLLARTLAPDGSAPADAEREPSYFEVDLRAGTWAVTQLHRDPLRATGAEKLLPFAQLGLNAELARVAAGLRIRSDQWFLNDPQFPDGEVVEHHGGPGEFDYALRTEDGYLEVQFPTFAFFAGRIYRNWGIPHSHGLLVSDYSYSYDQAAYRIGIDCLNVVGFVAQLDEFPGSVKRWLSVHRLNWRPRQNLALAAGEAVVYSGENRSFDFRLSNPISVWLVGGFGRDSQEGPNSNNSFTELSAWWRPFGGTVTYLSLMIDDFPGGGTPALYAGTASLQFPALTRRLGLRIDYAQVAALTYRSKLEHQVYTFRDIGVGRDLADADLFSLQLDWFPHPSLSVSPIVQVLRRGEGDVRDPWPANVTESGPTLFIGEVETTLRLAVSGTWLPTPPVWIEWDVGPNFVWDRAHVEGRDHAELVGRLKVSVGWRDGGWP